MIQIPIYNPIALRPYKTVIKRTEIGINTLPSYDQWGIGITPLKHWSEVWMAGKSLKFQIWVHDDYNFDAANSTIYSIRANGTVENSVAFNTISTDITPGSFGPTYTVYTLSFPMPSDAGCYKIALKSASTTEKDYYFISENIEIIPPEYFNGYRYTDKENLYLQLDYKHYENVLGMVWNDYYTMFVRANLQEEDSTSGTENYEDDPGNLVVTQITPKQMRSFVTYPMPTIPRENLIFVLGLSDLIVNNDTRITLEGDITRNDIEGTNFKSIVAPVQISDFDGFVKQYDADQYYITTTNPIVITEDNEIGITNNE